MEEEEEETTEGGVNNTHPHWKGKGTKHSGSDDFKHIRIVHLYNKFQIFRQNVHP